MNNRLLNDLYRIMVTIDQDGFKGKNIYTNQWVYIKRVHANFVLPEDIQKIQTSKHSHIIQLLDVFVFEDHTYLVYEWFESKHIHLVYCEHLSEWIFIFLQILDALDFIEEQGALFSLIIPEHIFVNSKKHVKMMVPATMFTSHQYLSNRTEFEQILHVMSYSSPESFHLIDSQGEISSSIYSLGVLFFSILAGKNPFWSYTKEEIIYKHMTFIPSSLDGFESTQESLPIQSVEKILHKMLLKSPKDRYHHFRDILIQFQNLVSQSTFPLYKKDVSVKLREPLIAEILGTIAGNLSDPLRIYQLSGDRGVGKSYILQEIAKYTQQQNFVSLSITQEMLDNESWKKEPRVWFQEILAKKVEETENASRFLFIFDTNILISEEMIQKIQNLGQCIFVFSTDQESTVFDIPKRYQALSTQFFLPPFSKEDFASYLRQIFDNKFVIEPMLFRSIYSFCHGNLATFIDLLKNFYQKKFLIYKEDRWILENKDSIYDDMRRSSSHHHLVELSKLEDRLKFFLSVLASLPSALGEEEIILLLSHLSISAEETKKYLQKASYLNILNQNDSLFYFTYAEHRKYVLRIVTPEERHTIQKAIGDFAREYKHNSRLGLYLELMVSLREKDLEKSISLFLNLGSLKEAKNPLHYYLYLDMLLLFSKLLLQNHKRTPLPSSLFLEIVHAIYFDYLYHIFFLRHKKEVQRLVQSLLIILKDYKKDKGTYICIYTWLMLILFRIHFFSKGTYRIAKVSLSLIGKQQKKIRKKFQAHFPSSDAASVESLPHNDYWASHRELFAGIFREYDFHMSLIYGTLGNFQKAYQYLLASDYLNRWQEMPVYGILPTSTTLIYAGKLDRLRKMFSNMPLFGKNLPDDIPPKDFLLWSSVLYVHAYLGDFQMIEDQFVYLLLERVNQVDIPFVKYFGLTFIGFFFMQKRKLSSAKNAFQQSDFISRKYHITIFNPMITLHLGQIALWNSDFSTVKKCLRRYRRYLDHNANPLYILEYLKLEISLMLEYFKTLPQSIFRIMRIAKQLIQKHKWDIESARLSFLYAKMYFKQQKYQEALIAQQDSLEMFITLNLPLEKNMVRQWLSTKMIPKKEVFQFHELDFLTKVSSLISKQKNGQDLIRSIFHTVLEMIGGNGGGLFLLLPEGDLGLVYAENLSESFEIPLDLKAKIYRNSTPLFDRSRGFLSLYLPIYTSSSFVGCIYIENHYLKEKIKESLVSSLTIFSNLFAILLLNAQNYKKLEERNSSLEKHVQERMKDIYTKYNSMTKELELAKNFQLSLLPKNQNIALSEKHSLEFEGWFQSTYETSGDFYDFFPIDAQRHFFFIGDFTGHGIEPAFMTVILKMLFLQMPEDYYNNLQDVLFYINQALFKMNKGISLVGAFGVLDTQKEQIQLIGCGNIYVASFQDTWTTYTLSGFGLGLFQSEYLDYTEYTLSFSPGTRLFLSTDGISELKIQEENKEMFVGDILIDWLNTHFIYHFSLDELKLKLFSYQKDIVIIDDVSCISLFHK